ncbi:hypothetical protein RDABS01_004297, partial [Bienertia sinuspersici]
MKPYWSVNVLIILLSLVLVVKGVNVGLNFYEDNAMSSGSSGTIGRLVKKDERVPVVATEFGEISSVDVDDGVGKRANNYHMQFMTLEPNSVFLPVLLHADMVFYVQTGSGKISWTDSDELNEVNLQRGDVYRLKSGTLFYLHSSLEAERPRLRLIAVFTNPEEQQLQGRLIGPYSSINDLVRGFDKRVLQAAFQVPHFSFILIEQYLSLFHSLIATVNTYDIQVSEEVIEELTSAIDTPAIVHAEPRKKNFWQQELLLINAFLGIKRYSKQITENKKKHTKSFNFFKEDPDFKNCNGWSTVVTKENLHALKGSNIGVFMVNLTKGSMMGPHWNPMASEVSVVLEGEGMVRVVCPSALINKECKNSRFKIEEGDVFTVPRFHPMAQTSFNNGSLVFMGFSTTTKKNHPQFLAGKASVLQTLSRSILGASFNVSNTTIDQLLAAQEEAIILDCTSCAEEQEMLLEDQIEKERQEEEEKREEEEEARRREEKEEQRRREEEREREEEEERKRQEEEEERKKREEEEQRRQEEEKQRKREREKKEERRREEEEKEKREREEEERRQQEEEQRRQEEEEEERQREDEEEKRRKERQRVEEEEKRRKERQREEEEEKQREEEEQRRQEEEEEERQREERQREEEEEKQREEEEQQRQEEKARQRKEEEEERQRRQEERREKEEQQRRREEESERREKKRRQKERGRGEKEEPEQEIARREEEERREWEKRAEEAARKRQEKEERRFLRQKARVSDAY